ncbi:MAG: MarR family transcriptional regulator [Armatimonadetes bacterium]|nr:MarR family transcriptional regulator [Armatimonadota bacterium]
MEKSVEQYVSLSKILYDLCSKKEMIRRQCLKLGKMECDLLNYLNAVDKPVCMNDLSVQMRVSHSRITRIIDTLVRKKLVKRFPSKRDRRSWLAQITENGKASDKKTISEFTKMQERLIEHLPAERVDAVYECVHLYISTYLEVLKIKEDELYEMRHKN